MKRHLRSNQATPATSSFTTFLIMSPSPNYFVGRGEGRERELLLAEPPLISFSCHPSVLLQLTVPAASPRGLTASSPGQDVLHHAISHCFFGVSIQRALSGKAGEQGHSLTPSSFIMQANKPWLFPYSPTRDSQFKTFNCAIKVAHI